MTDIEPRGDLLVMAEGRARFLRDRGEIKTPELLDELKAELREAREIIGELLEIKGDGPADLLRQANMGIGSKTVVGRKVLRASAFLNGE